MEVRLTFLLMGKTGQGKSATGNCLLKRPVFKTSNNVNSETKEVDFSFAHFGNYTLMVVDGPGLADTDMSKTEDTIAAVKNMDIALGMCYGGVDAFLFVFKFGCRFTAEDTAALEALKRIFGHTYKNHVIVVVTYGDNYHSSMEDDQCDITFHEWCKEQTGEFQQLYEDCEGRFVLFNNKEKDEEKMRAQIHEIIELAHCLRNRHGRYTSKCFLNAEKERKKLILELKAPQLTLEIQENVSLLTADIEALPEQPSDAEQEKIRVRIQDLKCEIEIQDKEYGVLENMREQVENVEHSLHDAVKRKDLAKELESSRKATSLWSAIGSALITLVSSPVIAVVAAGTAISNITLGTGDK